MNYHSHPALPGRPGASTLFFICAFALLGLSHCVSVSAQDNRYRLVSAADGAGQVEGDNDSSEAAVSPGGRFVAFTSTATNLVANDANGIGADVFVRDMQTGMTTLVTCNAGGTIIKFNISHELSMSADGRYVAFTCRLPDLGENVYVRDMQYVGYLRRKPDAAPDTDFMGYDFWLSKLNGFNGDFVKAEMVKAFISSAEYRLRFGQ